MHRGEIWVARLNPNQGAEVGKVRPDAMADQPRALDRTRSAMAP
jgi:mRNA-degrading endonuclease toxin of MazEF toxin-antitoxin module